MFVGTSLIGVQTLGNAFKKTQNNHHHKCVQVWNSIFWAEKILCRLLTNVFMFITDVAIAFIIGIASYRIVLYRIVLYCSVPYSIV